MTNNREISQKSSREFRNMKSDMLSLVLPETVSEKSLVLVSFVLVNMSGRVDSSDTESFFQFFFLKTTSKWHKTADNLLTAFYDQINHINFTDRYYLCSTVSSLHVTFLN